MSERILDIQNLSVTFGGLHALRDLNFHVDEGEMAGVERTHRRHEGDPAARRTFGVGPGLELSACGDDLHVGTAPLGREDGGPGGPS